MGQSRATPLADQGPHVLVGPRASPVAVAAAQEWAVEEGEGASEPELELERHGE